MAAIKRGVQAALFRLGRVPHFHQTDNSTAATHDLPSGKRDFNQDYRDFVGHFGMKPRTIEPGQSHQNGDVEALNGSLKRRVEQHLLLRGSRDFATAAAYEAWIDTVIERANRTRSVGFGGEGSAMAGLTASRLPLYPERSVRGSSNGR